MNLPEKPFVHLFVRRRSPLSFCVLCGTVRRRVGPQSRCRGLAHLTLRTT